MGIVIGMDGLPFYEGRAFGRVFRVFFKSWAWPYTYRVGGCRFAGVMNIGVMVFVPTARYVRDYGDGGNNATID
jgi:hypothetical protein